MALSNTQVKFYRGLNTAYTASIDTWKDGIFFSMDEHVIYHNGIKFGGIDPKYFEGTTKDFDIEGSTVRFKKLDENGAWQNVTIKLVKADDKSIVIGDLANGDVIDGFTVKVNVKDVADADGLKLGEDGLYVDFTKTNAAIKTNKDAIDVLNGADTVSGSVAKSIKDAVEALGAEAVGGTGKVITTISEANGVIAATAIDLTAESVAATAIEASDDFVAVEGANVKAQVESLAKSIKSVSSAAKSYRIASITDKTEVSKIGTNVKEAYKLVDEDGIQAGETIKIYKDSSLKEVALDGQMLNFTYILADGSEKTVGVDVSTFLAESEFSDGLEVVDHVVKVKKAEGSEGFLTVGADGVKLDGVQAAINTAAAAAKTKVEKTGEGSHITVTSSKSNSDSSVTYTISESDIASANALTAETTARESADTALSDRLGDGVTSSSTATAQFAELSNKLGTGITTVATVTEQLKALSGSSTSDTSNTISVIGAKKYTDAKVEALDLTQVGGADKVITTISQADGKVSASAIDLTASNVKATESTGVPTAVDVIGETVSEQIASLATSIKSVESSAEAAHTVVNAKNSGHVTVSVSKEGSHDVVTITEDDIASATDLGTETTARQSQDDKIEASIGLAADGSHKTTTGNYTSDATTVVGEIAALDTKLKKVSDTLGTGVTTAEGKTVTEQLQALSGETSDKSDATSVNGAKAYAKDLVDNLDATVESTTESTLETTTTKAIKIIQTNGKIASITLGAFDCGVY